ncbi:hypothetical protein CRYUN_Cryun24cG0080900 [Craigia yunnanensis]
MYQTREQWVVALRNLDTDSVNWKAPWMSRKSVLYGCDDKLWIPLLGLWGVVSYTSLLVLRQFGSEQFIPTTHGLNELISQGHESLYASPKSMHKYNLIMQAYMANTKCMISPLLNFHDHAYVHITLSINISQEFKHINFMEIYLSKS